MDNKPKIYNSDGELLAGMAGGDCDLGLTNHYYLARALDENPNFPVTPAWPDQNGAGAHANVSGAGVVKSSTKKARARKLVEYLTTKAAQEEIVQGGEFPVNREVSAKDSAASWQTVKIDPIDAAKAGPLIPDAIELMLDLGWR
jgi:iron(III) transport system substrate-binding protein